MIAGKTGLTVGGTSLFIFLVITILVFSNTTESLDQQLALAIDNSKLGAAATAFMVTSAEYGREYFWIPIVGVMLVLGTRETKLLAIELTALFVSAVVIGEALKFVLYRPRPFETLAGIVRLLPIQMDSSYPSGHALIVSVGAAFALAKFKRRTVSWLLTFEAAVVCFSRVYVGMHYPLDVLASIFLALGISGVGLFILNRYLEPLMRRLTLIAARIFGDGPLEM